MIKRLLHINVCLVFGLALLQSCKGDEPTSEFVLPFLGPKDLDYKMVDGVEVADTVYHTIAPFVFFNQDSTRVSSTSLEGKIWISDFFFTHCPTICPPMTSQMKSLNASLKDMEDEIYFLSFSIDPKRDTPSRLREYRKMYDIKAKNWLFFTGDEAETHQLGIESFLVHAGQDPSVAGGYAHGDIFTLVDREGRVRGVYHGTEVEEVKQLEKDVRKLLKYEYGVE